METKNKPCGRCGKVTRMWKSKTRDKPQMCASCVKKEPREPKTGDTIGTMRVTEIIKTSSGPISLTVSPSVKGKIKAATFTIPELLRQAEKVFNAWIHKRDTYNDGSFICISCGYWKSLKVGQAGHYYPKTFAATRFHEDNVNLECESCNCHDPNHLIGYKMNLLAKIGIERMKELKRLHNQPFKWERGYLMEIIEKYK